MEYIDHDYENAIIIIIICCCNITINVNLKFAQKNCSIISIIIINCYNIKQIIVILGFDK